ncbi:MAG: SOS response-associated peptidase [Siculibacillus sp.]|nr:SOS response-associated peptidase [Siculibacillus sp.]
MCGRFTLTSTPEEVRRLFDFADRPNFPPREDIRPTEPIGVVAIREGARRFLLVRWGFVPGWVKDPREFSLLINARAETAAQKPSFRGAMRHGRCLVPANGFYEWRSEGSGPKRPHLIAPADGRLVAFAGLTETWAGADGSEVDTAAILTVPANDVVAPIHDRMPAVIPPEHFADWLDTARVDAKAAAKLLVPAPADLFVATALPTSAERRASARPRPAPKAATPPAKPKPKDDQFDLF